VRGEILELKESVNGMMESLSVFADEMMRVAREVGTEGKLEGPARVVRTSIAKVVASVAQIALQTPHLDLIRDLERDPQTLDRIGVEFWAGTLAVWYFAEELAITGVRKVCTSPICGVY
jgi:hypothetical protein